MEYDSSPSPQKLATGSPPKTPLSNTAVLAVRTLDTVIGFTLWWRQYILPKGCSPSTKSHGVITTQKTAIWTSTTVNTPNLSFSECWWRFTVRDATGISYITHCLRLQDPQSDGSFRAPNTAGWPIYFHTEDGDRPLHRNAVGVLASNDGPCL